MKEVEPHIFADIRFYPADKGGRKVDIPADVQYYGCPFKYEGQLHDCRLLLKDIGGISPGDLVERVPIVFLCPGLVLHKLKENDTFLLWEGGERAEGTILEIVHKDV